MGEETREPGAIKYHYNREERTASLPDRVKESRGKGRILRGNRSLAITFLDVAFLVALIIVFSAVSRLMGDNSIIPGYTISVKATAFGERVFVSVKIQARKDSAAAEAVRIRIGYPGSGDRVELNDFLPAVRKTEQIYRGSLSFDSSREEVRITVYSGTEMGSMTARIKEE